MNPPAVESDRPASAEISDISGPLGDLVERLTARLKQGERVDFEEFLTAHPQYAEALRQVYPALVLLAGLSGGSADPAAAGSVPAIGRCTPAGTSDAISDSAQRRDPDGTLGDFRIIREVGRGGMGVVYEAEQISLKRRVALKVLPFAGVLDPRQLQRFQNEAQAAAGLHHTNIVPVYAVGCERGVHYYAMQFIEGLTLAAVIFELRAHLHPPVVANEGQGSAGPDPNSAPSMIGQGPDPKSHPRDTALLAGLTTACTENRSAWFRQVAELGIQAAEALDYAHQMGVVHRDIKPSNLILDAAGRLWITDFGVARVDNEAGLTMTGEIVGTLRYMSPEQIEAQRGIVDHRSDVYSLGATLYELLALQPACPGNDRRTLVRQIADDDPLPLRRIDPAIPADLETVVLKALGKSAGERYGTAKALADELQRFVGHLPIVARRPRLWERAAKLARRHRGIFNLALVFALVAAAASTTAAIVFWRQQEQLVRLKGDVTTQRDAAVTALAEFKAATLENERLELLRTYPTDLRVAFRLLDDDHPQQRMIDVLEGYLPRSSQVDVRSFEWFHLWSRCHLPKLELNGHLFGSFDLAASPDGSLLASAGQEGAICLWSVESGRLIEWLPRHRGNAHCVTFSRDGSRLASGGSDKMALIWDRSRPKGPFLRLPHKLPVEGLAFTHDGTKLVSWGGDQPVQLWDAQTGAPLIPLTGPAGFCDPHPDGRHVAIAVGAQVHVWDIDSQELKLTLQYTGRVSSVAYSQNGELLASGCDDGSVHLWEGSAGRELGTLPALGRIQAVETVGFCDDDATLIVQHTNGAVRNWDVAGQKALDSWLLPRPWRLRLRPITSTHKFATAVVDSVEGRGLGLPVQVYDRDRLNGRRWSEATSREVGAIAFAPDGRTVATAERGGTLVIRSVEDGSSIHQIQFPELNLLGIWDVAYSHDGRHLAVGMSDYSVRLYDTKNWNDVQRLREGKPGVLNASVRVAFAPDDRTLAVSCPDPVTLFDIESRQVAQQLPDAHQDALAVDWSRDGKYLGLGYRNGLVRVWNLSQQQFVSKPESHADYVYRVTISPDGQMLASCNIFGNGSRQFKVHYLDSARSIGLVIDSEGATTDVKFSPDGRLLAVNSAAGQIAIWDTAAKLEVMRLSLGGSWDPMCFAYSPDGRYLVVGGKTATPSEGAPRARTGFVALLGGERADRTP